MHQFAPAAPPASLDHTRAMPPVSYPGPGDRDLVDLMAVIVVGDVDRDAVTTMITEHFSSLSSPSPARPRPVFDVPDHASPRYLVVSDKETTATAVQISNLRPARDQGSVGGYRKMMLDQLFAAMLGDRLDEVSQSPNPPFLRAAAGRALFPAPRTRDEAVLQALVSNDGVPRGLDALVTELQRVARFGFTASELARAKQAMMGGFERAVTESPDRESSSRADEYTRNFLEDEALPTIWQELAFHRRFLPGITLAEINALTSDWFPEANRLVVLSAPDGAGVQLPSETQLAAVVSAASAKRVERYVDAAAGKSVIKVPLKQTFFHTILTEKPDVSELMATMTLNRSGPRTQWLVEEIKYAPIVK